jgi:glyoxylase-like metal-dependent hydrolase (beta-lactamase superfamily II)
VLPTLCLFLTTGSHRVLVDTGIGAAPGEDPGMLHTRLQSVGITPQSIDTVILSHWHGDHVLGCLLEGGKLAYPNARYVMWKTEWEWTTAEVNRKLVQDFGGERNRATLLAIADKLQIIGNEEEIVPGICAIAAPGHTIGHMALVVSSGSEKLLCIGDLAHHPIHLEHLDWRPDFDYDREQASATARALFARAAGENMLVFGAHMPPMGVGRIARDRAGFSWVPG